MAFMNKHEYLRFEIKKMIEIYRAAKEDKPLEGDK